MRIKIEDLSNGNGHRHKEMNSQFFSSSSPSSFNFKRNSKRSQGKIENSEIETRRNRNRVRCKALLFVKQMTLVKCRFFSHSLSLLCRWEEVCTIFASQLGLNLYYYCWNDARWFGSSGNADWFNKSVLINPIHLENLRRYREAKRFQSLFVFKFHVSAAWIIFALWTRFVLLFYYFCCFFSVWVDGCRTAFRLCSFFRS